MSLAQLLVASAITSVMLTGLWMALDEGQRVYAAGSAQVGTVGHEDSSRHAASR